MSAAFNIVNQIGYQTHDLSKALHMPGVLSCACGCWQSHRIVNSFVRMLWYPGQGVVQDLDLGEQRPNFFACTGQFRSDGLHIRALLLDSPIGCLVLHLGTLQVPAINFLLLLAVLQKPGDSF